ncbi:hypothetical protein [Aminobacter sp. Piv2-1]|uniref:hypothetical protein n=1 Tax=Aminobacter sp. Piv2-1 TaxID=3031122 RepID=UPI0030B11233
MNKTVAELGGRWMTRKADALSELEHKVLQSAIDRKPVARNVNDSIANCKDINALAERMTQVTDTGATGRASAR